MSNIELIPNMFCYIDFFININCVYFGLFYENQIVDDFLISDVLKENKEKYYSSISDIIKYLYLHKKLLNDNNISKGISQWIDIIFCKKQFPQNERERKETCNIYDEYKYEKKINLDEKLKEYLNICNTNTDNTIEKELTTEINSIMININNFGICPRQILTETISVSKLKLGKKFQRDLKADLYFYFTTKNEQHYSVFENKKDLTKNVEIWNNNLKDSTNFKSNNFEINIPNYYNRSEYLNLLYKPNYSISAITLINLYKKSEILILACRYYGNYFKVQNSEREIKVYCEDFVTTNN